MNRRSFSRWTTVLVLVFAVCALATSVFALAPRPQDARFDARVKTLAGGVIGLRAVDLGQLPADDVLRQDWDAFVSGRGGGWSVKLDRRSGLPLIANGRGIPWYPARGNALDSGPAPSVDDLAHLALEFVESHAVLLGRWGTQMVLDREASGPLGDGKWQVVFRQEVDGVRVDGARYDFQVSWGNLVAFGARRWAPVRISAIPDLARDEARAKLDAWLGVEGHDGMVDVEPGTLALVPVDPAGANGADFEGVRGEGYDHRLVWRFAFVVPGEDPTWVGEVDAHTGEILAFYDDTKYQQVKGHVSPISDDGDCATGGCLEPGYPMPFANYTEDGGATQYTGDFGLYECTTLGSTIATSLNGPYFRISDACGPVSASTTCDDDLDLGVAAGINCSVAPGASAGNTDAARSAFFSLGRVNQKARFWNPSNTWLNAQVTCNTNVNSTCNASWGGAINMYRAGNGCGNTSQIQGVVTHEWGHGYDQNDGGGYDNPSEAYGDVTAIFEARESCVGHGFRPGVNCSGYGDTCLSCTGIRDMDWDARTAHTPATPSGFLTSNCGGGGGACGKEVHCESYVPSEAMFDLATRDLPAMGIDADTAWQIAENLWYRSRPGSGGDVYNCALPSSDSCSTASWYQEIRLQDDDDGDLNNGTPHAAAIFAAFDRHDIACGNASSPENQNTSTCPTLAAPSVTAKALTNAVELSWAAVPSAALYRVYRSEIGCERSQVPIGETSGTTFTDDGLANDFSVYYRVQAVGGNDACEGAVSTCLATSAQPLAGRVQFDRATYGCSNRIGLRVTDANHPGATVDVTVWSDTEPTPETVVLTETAPGSGKFTGEIFTTSAPPAPDGELSTTNGDLLTAQYIDLDDGQGGTDVPRQANATSDCVFPVITNVGEQNVTGSSAQIAWNTNEVADTEVNWGPTAPLANTATGDPRTTAHSVQLSGLAQCTVYYYDVHSTDPAGNLAADDNGGQHYRFETLGDFGQGLQPCHAGQVTVQGGTFSCSDSVALRLVDIDLNLDPGVADTATVLLTSTTETDPEVVVLTETGPNTSTFTGAIATGSGAPAPDGVLEVRGGDLLTATYHDADDGAGYPATSFDTAAIDCGGPVITGLGVGTLTNARATFSWTTDEPADTVLEWGPSPALGQTVSSSTRSTSHQVTVNRFETCGAFYFRVSGTDAYGNLGVADDHGQPFAFTTWDIPGVYGYENFENGQADWTLDGEWQIGAPQGLGGSSGLADPTAAYNNAAVLGHDLTGLGANPGDYEPGVTESARSPIWNASAWTGTKLLLHRRLNVGSGDEAQIVMYTNGIGRPIYRSNGDPVTESGYQEFALDLGAFVDGAATFQLEFRQSSNASGNYSGWNVDDVILKDGTRPDYGPCGACGAAPAFAGATSAVDNDACGATGVTVSWQKAAAWGTGGGGTYAVYRDAAPGFTPSASNRIADGVTTLSWVDASAPTDQTSYYLVRAENDETCAAGPHNGGVTDANAAYAAVGETTSRPLPPEVTTVTVGVVAGTHVRLSWDAVPDAASYRIYRSPTPDPADFGLLGTTSTTVYDDIGEATNANTYYYKVVPANACGDEGP